MNLPHLNRFSSSLLSLLALLLLSHSALSGELVVLGVYTQNTPVLIDSTANTSFSAATGFGAGFQFSTPIYGRIELELGADYTQRSWNDSLSGTLLLPAYDFPLGLRLRIFRFLALDAGAYYSSINGTSRVAYISNVDYGAYGGAQLMIPLGHSGALFLAGRYLYGIANVSSIGGQLSFRGFETLGGYQFNLSRDQNR